MASVTKHVSPASSRSPRGDGRAESGSVGDQLSRGVNRVYRFLASVKLAVFSLGALAATLAYATFFESWYGAAASQEYIYRSPGFAILLAFLATNILCAALIRYPWKKRQTGFVVTHAGLLIVLFGSFFSVRTSDEGQVGMLEGDVKGELVRIDYPVIRIQEVDPHTREQGREYDLPFHPGPFAWGPGNPRSPGILGRLVSLVSLGSTGSSKADGEVISEPGDPFRFVVKEHLPAAAEAKAHVADPGGSPMIRLGLKFKGPRMPKAQDAFESEEDHWFVTETRFYRVARSQPPALLTFAYVDRRELVNDFLKPAATTGAGGVARFRYQDRSGQPRTYDWALEGQQGKSIVLPESDLTVTLNETTDFPTHTARLSGVLGEDAIPIAVFKIQAGQNEPVTHMALANLPMVPNVIPSAEHPEQPRPAALAQIHYMVYPTLDPKTNGRFGQIDILAGPDQSLYYRVFGRGKGSLGELRAAGPLTKGENIVAFGGGANMDMTITFAVDQFFAAGVEKQIYEPVVLPKGQMGNGIAACRAEMTVDGQTKEIWLSRSENLDPPAPVSWPFATRSTRSLTTSIANRWVST